MKRLAYNSLLKWSALKIRKPLLIEGARGSGKTTLVNEFAKRQFVDHFLSIDLKSNQRARQLFNSDEHPLRALTLLSSADGQKIIPGKTLIFFDHAMCQRGILEKILRIMDEAPELHVIAADDYFVPALSRMIAASQYFTILGLRPLCFAEYLATIGREDAATVVLNSPCKISTSMHQYLMSELRNYFLVGGLPEVVKTFQTTRALTEPFEIQESFIKHIKGYLAEINADCSDEIAESVYKHIARHPFTTVRYAEISKTDPMTSLKRGFDALCDARILFKVQCVDPEGPQFQERISSRHYKSLYFDIGIFSAACGLHRKLNSISPHPLDAHQGHLAEQFLGQELAFSQGTDPMYWLSRVNGSSATVDYITCLEGLPYVLGIQRESNPSLDLYVRTCLQTFPDCPGALIFGAKPFIGWTEHNVQHLPLYYAYSATGGAKIDLAKLPSI